MRINNNGLTLIELLVTIAVIAVVAAISVPVVNNVIQSSNEAAAEQMNTEVDSFTQKYSKVGAILFYAVEADALGRTMEANTIYGFLDTNGDGAMSADELVEGLTIDEKFVLVDEDSSPYSIIEPNNFRYPGGSGFPADRINIELRD
jgi:prepilin-type N-terminal cleavage/methylation domain-containing protein